MKSLKVQKEFLTKLNKKKKNISKKDLMKLSKAFEDTSLDYEEWIKVGMAIHSEYPCDYGLKCWTIVSQNENYTKGDLETCKDKWKSFDDTGDIKIGTVFHLLNELGGSVPRLNSYNDGNDKNDRENEQQYAKLVKILESRTKIFKTKEQLAYIDIPELGGCTKIDSSIFKDYARNKFYLEFSKMPNRITMDNTIQCLAAKAVMGEISKDVNIRYALSNDAKAVYVKSGDKEKNIIKLKPSKYGNDHKQSFQVINESEIFFSIRNSELPLAWDEIDDIFSNKDRLDLFFDLIGITSEKIKILIIAWLVCSMCPALGAYPLLVLQGAQGTGKSTIISLLVELIDPNLMTRGTLPSDIRDLSILCKNSHVLSFDNISNFSPRISDALCKIATGGQFAIRKLYSDDELSLFSHKSPVILNGITVSPDKGDLLERSLIINLDRIKNRKSPEEINHSFSKIRGNVFSALLQLLSNYLYYQGQKKDYKFRMTNLEEVGCIIEKALGYEEGFFSQSYEEVLMMGSVEIVENDPVVNSMLRKYGPNDKISMSPTQLYNSLKNYSDNRYFPKSINGFSKKLKRLEPDLIRNGFEFETQRTSNSRKVIIRMPSASSPIWKIKEEFENEKRSDFEEMSDFDESSNLSQ